MFTPYIASNLSGVFVSGWGEKPVFLIVSGGNSLVLLQNGNVGVGIPTPSSLFHISGGRIHISQPIAASQDLIVANANARVFEVGTNAGGHGILNLRTAGASYGIYLSANGDSFITGGNVGIGTTTPAYPLDIQSPSESMSILRAQGANSNAPDIHIRKARGFLGQLTGVQIGDFLGHINFAGYDGSSYVRGARISSTVKGTGVGIIQAELGFHTKQADGNEIQRMVITESGNVGIGLTNPRNYLTISGGGTGAFSHIGYGLGINSAVFGHIIQVDSDQTSAALRVLTAAGAIEAFRVQGNGNVGIGTSSPNSTLHVTGNIRSEAGRLYQHKQISTNYSVTTNDFFLYCNNPTGITLSFPSAATFSGQLIRTKLLSTGHVVITGVHGQFFDGLPSIVQSGRYSAFDCHSDGSNWYLW